MKNRINAKITLIGTTESGITIKDENGNLYHWITKAYNSPIFYMLDSEWISVSMTVYNNSSCGNKIVKNVRIIKNK